MYEIWLIINTFYELAMANLGLVIGVLAAWLALMVVAGMKKHPPGVKASCRHWELPCWSGLPALCWCPA